jgi:DNA-binding XRE family transcriptional regulator
MTSCINATYPEYSFGNDGYPRAKRPKSQGGVTSAVRFLWEQANGPIAKGYEPDHTCKNILCINLEHIEIVTSTENNARAHRKLNADQVREIRHRLSSTTKAALAKEFGVSYMTITHIERYKTWKDLV